jgi:hypothetical protein
MTNSNLEKGIPWRFGPDWPGQRCGAKNRKDTPCQRPAYSETDAAPCTVANRQGPRQRMAWRGLQRIVPCTANALGRNGQKSIGGQTTFKRKGYSTV